MNFCGYEPVDLVNGEGVRCSLWVSGCNHMCKGCFNKKAWSFSYGSEFLPEQMEKLIQDMSKPFIDGLTILGGEPLDPKNIDKVVDILSAIRDTFGNKKDIMIYTGYTFQEVPDRIKNLVDIIMDGRYDESLPTTRRFRGSDNQIMWVKKEDVWKKEN